MIRPQPSILDKPDVLALVWELHSRLPETRSREPYELQSLLWSLGYCEDLIPECEIAAAIEAARLDWCRMRPVFNLGDSRTVVGWDRLALCELVEDQDRGRVDVNVSMPRHQAEWKPVYAERSGGRSVVFQPRSEPS
jgi:hypothetical protein